MRFVYHAVDGMISNLRFVADNYQLQAGEISGTGDRLPAQETLPEYREQPPPVPNVISDRQFFQALAMQGVIAPEEALAAVKTGTLPAAMLAFLEPLPAEQRFGAEMLLSGATQFMRDHPMVSMFAQALGWTEGQADDLWRFAETL